MERAGRSDEAFRAFESALEVAPDCLAAVEGAASSTARHGRDDARMGGWLHTIALRGETPAWRDWAAQQQTRD
jgi:hypothetical protein